MKTLAHSIAIVGLLLAFLPVAGLPQSWQHVAFVVGGLYVAGAALFLTYRRVLAERLIAFVQQLPLSETASRAASDTQPPTEPHTSTKPADAAHVQHTSPEETAAFDASKKPAAAQTELETKHSS